MITFDDFEQTKRDIAELERQKERKLGALEQLKEQLRGYDCATVKEAVELIPQLQAERDQAGRDWTKAHTEFKEAMNGSSTSQGRDESVQGSV